MPIIKRPKLETYGKIKDFSKKSKVILFFSSLLVFTLILTIARYSILLESEYPSVTGFIASGANSANGIENDRSIDTGSFQISSLALSPIVQDLPKNALIGLKIGSRSYIIKKSSITSGKAPNPDILISLPESYNSRLNGNLCAVVAEASNNGDLKITTHLSKTALAWKYRSVFKYRSCIGL